MWNVAKEYPDGFDGSVWAVASGSDGVGQTSDYVRVVYDPANVPTQTEFSLPVTFYTYSGDILNPIAEKLSANEKGQINLPDTVFIEIDVPSGVISYKLYWQTRGRRTIGASDRFLPSVKYRPK
ncbi:hypothetical protein [Desulfosporosinus orientis]|uniref:hypothetical protein n=1 Tax=Desulfosporosinus orientis TaxID=1563 RepID=UPI0002E374AA|nr:hypothetical protein [Desulfosporosinus orientis]